MIDDLGKVIESDLEKDLKNDLIKDMWPNISVEIFYKLYYLSNSFLEIVKRVDISNNLRDIKL
jgi:hypothetical protein